MSYIDVLIYCILAFIMFSVGLSLRPRDFVETFAHPRPFLYGLTLQIIYLPALAFLITWLAPLEPAFAVGMIILAACPGGMTSNFISYLLSANTALSIALTVTNSIIALVSVPFVINLGLLLHLGRESDLSLPFGPTVGQIFSITVIPVFFGILVRRLRPEFATTTQETLRWITLVLLGVLFVVKFFASEEYGGSGISPAEVFHILPYSVLINVLALSSGYLVGRWRGLSTDEQVTIGVEVGIQNTSLAFLIAATLLSNEDMLKPALVYAMFTFFTAVLYGLLLKPGEWRKMWRKLRVALQLARRRREFGRRDLSRSKHDNRTSLK